MKRRITIEKKEPVIGFNANIPYAKRSCFAGCATQSMELSLLVPRTIPQYGEKGGYPLIVWICGGGFTEMDRNGWTAELEYFAKRGYAVASVDYTVTQHSKWRQQIIDIKEAIRWLRAHESEYPYDASRIAVMGESAGGYFTSAIAATGETREFDIGENLDQSSAVQAAIPFYPPINTRALDLEPEVVLLPRDIDDYLDPRDYISENTPPFLIFHGTEDSQVALSQGENLYDALEQAGVEADMYIVEGAEHAEAQFYQKETKEIILEFLRKNL